MPKELLHFAYDHNRSEYVCDMSEHRYDKNVKCTLTKIIFHYPNAHPNILFESICDAHTIYGGLSPNFVGCMIASKICGNEIKYYGDTVTIIINKNKKMLNTTITRIYYTNFRIYNLIEGFDISLEVKYQHGQKECTQKPKVNCFTCLQHCGPAHIESPPFVFMYALEKDSQTILQFECDLVSNFSNNGLDQDREHYVVNEHDIITEKIGDVVIFVIPILYYWDSHINVTRLNDIRKFLKHSKQTIEYYYIENPRILCKGDTIRMYDFSQNNRPTVFCLEIK
jgi:hypothetical protein